VAETWSLPAGSGEGWVDDYERGRPGWPEAAVGAAAVSPDATVVDLGAGTGKLTRLLVRSFRRVLAVEPSDAMRRRLAELSPEAEPLGGTGQALPLADASVDAVFAAQAFHWFADERALAEIARVLRPGGTLVVLWNEPAGPAEPSLDGVERLLREHMPAGELGYDPLDLGNPLYAAGELERVLGPLRTACFPHVQTLDREGVVSYYASMGWLAELRDDERAPLLERVRALLGAGEYRRPWETHVRWT
jgi:SAM-dependent methyltransferase